MMLTGTCAMPNEMSLWKTGMLTTALTGQSMAQTTSRQAAVATVESIALGETLAPSRPPAPKQKIEVLPIPRLDANAVSAAAGSRASAMQIRSGSRVNMAAVAVDRSGTKQAR